MTKLLSMLCALSICGIATTAADHSGKPIDTQRSSLLIHVGKAGLFSGAAHEHWVEAPIASGSIDAGSAAPSVRFAVRAASLTVRQDKKLSAKESAEVQSNMQTEVLESSKYPQIVFQSTRVQADGNGAWRVTGVLSLHGVSKPVIVPVKTQEGAFAGSVTIKQTDFGIHPIQIGGGLVKVKNELEIRFKIYVLSRP